MAEENRYKPPAAPVRDTGPPAPRPLTLAVLAGLGVCIGGMLLARAVVAIVYITLISEPDATPQQSVEALSTWLITLLSTSCIFSVLGGYVCARVARRHERRVTLVLAVLSTAIAYSTFAGNGALAALVLTLTFASAMAGGGLGRYRNLAERRKPAAAMVA